jgi:YfiH family protein
MTSQPDFRLLESADGVQLEQYAPLLAIDGVRHGFATRVGGASKPPASSLDFGRHSSPAQRRINRERLCGALEIEPERLYRVKQVHGRRVVQVGGGDDPTVIGAIEADALISDVPGVALGVLTADCVPVLIASRERTAFAAIHSGWRGTVAGVLQATIEALEQAFGCRPTELVAAIGPCVSGAAYEVSDEVAAEFAEIEGAVAIGKKGRPHVDLRRAVAHELAGCGVTTIGCSERCTVGEESLFFSYRRDGAKAGRQLNVVGCIAR